MSALRLAVGGRLAGRGLTGVAGAAERSWVWALTGVILGSGAIVVTSSGRATGTDAAVLALAGWVVGPVAAGVLAEFRPGHRLVRSLAVLGAVPLLVVVLEAAGRGGRPAPAELVSSPLLAVAAGVVILAGCLLGGIRSFRALGFGGAVAAGVWAGSWAAGPSSVGFAAGLMAAALAVASVVVIVTAPPWMHLGVVRALVLAVVVVALGSAVVMAVVVIAATVEVPGPAGTGPAFAILLGLGLVPLVSWAYRGLSVRLYGTSRQPGVSLVGLYDQVPRSSDPSDLVAVAAAAVARAVRSPSARVVAPVEVPDGSDRGLAVVPLVAGGEQLGSLVVDPRRQGETFGRRDLARLAELAPAVAATVRTARLAQALEEAHRELATLRETERRRLHHDLHDGMGPLLAGLGMQVASLRRAARRLDEPDWGFDGRLEEVADAVAECQAETRRLVDGLAPESLDRMDLQAALVDLATGWSSSLAGTGLSVEISCEDDLGRLPDGVRVAAYRIVAEAVTNAVRHAQAGRCRIDASTSGGSLHVRVIDDGVGADGHTPGVGLRSMQDRAHSERGRFRVSPVDPAVPPGQPGRGTVVEATFPTLERT